MEIDLGPEIAQFRAELREWIAAEAPEELAGLADWNMHVATGGNLSATLQEAADHPAYREWEQKLLAKGLICAGWPVEYGGGGLDPVRQTVVKQEFIRAGVPAVTRGGGESLVGPSVIAHGTAEQKAYFLPKILSGEHVYCQGFSEPGAGSDLAGLQTKGVVDGDEIVITGQKVWTSGAARANMIFILVRTDPTVPKHNGISYVLLDFKSAGVEYRPIKQMTGAAEFAEDFFDEARAPLFNVIGGLNNGWRVTMTTLTYERGGRATTGYLGFEREYWALVETARKNGRTSDPLVRQQLAWAYTQVSLMKFSGLRTLAKLASGKAPGPEASIDKLFWSEYFKKLGEVAAGIEGAQTLIRPEGEGYPVTFWQDNFLAGRPASIYAGSNEIQRNIIGERVLGLPKEPRIA
jgi:alkylation response protein AidB-like acyl-CoA dehydrogenase